MGSITETLKKHRIVTLDTCVWIYHFEQDPHFAALTDEILTAVAKGHCQGIISELTLMELITGPLKLDRQDIADEYELLISHFPNLTAAPISKNILLQAAQIRAVYGFKTPDAIILATAKEYNASLIVTNDQNWSNFQEIKSLYLTDVKQ